MGLEPLDRRVLQKPDTPNEPSPVDAQGTSQDPLEQFYQDNKDYLQGAMPVFAQFIPLLKRGESPYADLARSMVYRPSRSGLGPTVADLMARNFGKSKETAEDEKYFEEKLKGNILVDLGGGEEQ